MQNIDKEMTNLLISVMSFGTAAIFGAMAAYFAWRSRQLERQQLRQINREFEQDLANADEEINRGLVICHYWSSWSDQSGPMQAFQIYAMARKDLSRPDLPRLLRILSFHVPEEEARASDATIKVHAALGALDTTLQNRPTLPDSEVAERIVRIQATLEGAAADLKVVSLAIKKRRSELRR